MIPIILPSGKGKAIETIKKSVAARGSEEGEGSEQVKHRGF